MGPDAKVDFWRPDLAPRFEKSVQRLCSLTKTPFAEQKFNLPAEDRTGRVLRLKDELLIASHVAVLAHSADDVTAISAVAIEELQDGLVFRLASNERPKMKVVVGLREILNMVADFPTQGSTRSPKKRRHVAQLIV
jgi:hypothetical protein